MESYKKLNWIFMLIMFVNLQSQNYTVEIKVNEVWWNSPESFIVELQAEIYKDGILIPADSSYYYKWYTDFSHDNTGWYLLDSGFKKDEISPDQLTGHSILAYVIVTDSLNHTFTNIKSDTVGPLYMSGQAKTVIFKSYNETGTDLKDYIIPEHWRYSINRWKDGYRGLLTLYDSTGESIEEVLRAKPNYESSLQRKFKHWNENALDFQHYNKFRIYWQTDTLKASYYPVAENVVVKVVLMQGVETDYDSVELKDPWVIDTSDSRFYTAPYGYHSLGMGTPFIKEASPLALTFDSKYQGVFLNQNPDPNNPNKPYYSLRAQQQQVIPFHGEDITWYFQGWEGDNVSFQHPDQNETAVVFQADGAQARAVYKGHLASSVSGVSASNNQRKLVYDGTRYHLVYADGGEIYYSHTSGTGDDWSVEERLSDGTGNNQSPSIAINGNGDVAVVWQQGSQIVMRLLQNNQWSAYVTVYDMILPTNPPDTTPVVAALDGHFHVAWRDYSSMNGSNIKLRAYDWAAQMLGDWEVLSGTGSSSYRPTLASDHYNRLHVAWEENGVIYYSQLGYRDGYWLSVNKEDVSSGSGYSNNGYPSISCDGNRRANIIWEGFDDYVLYQEVIIHARRSGSAPNAWSYHSFVGNDDYYRPSITGFVGMGYGSDQLRAGWYRGNGNALLWIGQYDGSSWTDFYQGGSGYDPNLSVSAVNSGEAKLLYRKYSSAPYVLKSTSQDIRLGSTVAGFQDAGIGIGYRLLAEGSGYVHWLQIDSLYVGSRRIALQRQGKGTLLLGSSVFQVPVGALLVYRMATGEEIRPGGKELMNVAGVGEWHLGLVDASSSKVLMEIALEEEGLQAYSVDLSAYRGREVLLKLWYTPEGADTLKYRVVRLYYPGWQQMDLTDVPMEELKVGSQAEALPEQFTLYPAYPNPFNPSTTIRYGLPEASDVELEVYNVQGQRVRHLVAGYQTAGWHEVVWYGRGDNAQRLPSGVYVLRLKAQSSGGSAVVESRKVVLVK